MYYEKYFQLKLRWKVEEWKFFKVNSNFLRIEYFCFERNILR